MIRHLMLFVLVLPLIQCASMNSKTEAHSEFNKGRFVPGGTDYIEYHGIYFTGQPTKEEFKVAKEQGLEVVINLRTKHEIKARKENDEQYVKSLNMDYYNFPIDARTEIDGAMMAKIETTVMKHHPKQKIIVYCGSGQRAAAWFAHHVFVRHRDSKEKALNMAEQAGLTSDSLTTKVSTYLDQLPTSPPPSKAKN